MHQNIVCAKFSILHTLRCKSYKSDRLTNLDTFFVCLFSLPKYFGLRWHLISRQGRLKSEVKSELCSIVVIIVIFFSICVKIAEWSQYCGVKPVLSGVEWVEVKSVLNSTSNLLPPSPSLANSKLISTATTRFVMINIMILNLVIMCSHLSPLITAN